MIDATKYPKAAMLQQQREEQYLAEQARMKAEKLREEANAKVSIKQRGVRQQKESKDAEAAIARRKKK